MKKQYKTPVTESVKVNLFNSILEDIGVVNNSREVGDEGLAKEQGNYFDFGDDFGDIWGSDEDPKDPWKE